MVRRAIGFRSAKHLGDHFRKHGREFEGYTETDYLGAAQELRDRPAGGDILELNRGDGSLSRYDRKSGAFLAFDEDGTVRTFFKPNDGEAYFRRQARRSHQ
jgi:pyocin large subunit-like protein